jgi:hypothetical protein
MSDVLNYHTLDELQALSLPELAALWELVPTDRQRRYKTVYDREVKQAGAVGSDALEKQVAEELLHRYQTTALVPIGARWARTPTRIQEAVRNETDLVAPEAVEEQNRPKKPPVAILVVAGAAFVLMLFFILPRLGGRGQSTAANATLTMTATLTATPGKSPTPTPIALEQQDVVIQGGDSSRTVAFPVNLRVALPGSSQPRVFVVQRRVIQTAEWNFDPNPDTASYIAGLTVRPIIGVPYSPENAALFGSIAEGTTFTLQMNTGAALRFIFDQRLTVSRSDTGIFRQVGPGLVLALIGEHDASGAPTATRIVVTANYASDQELARDGALTGLLPTLVPTQTPSPSPTLPPFSQLEVQVIAVNTIPGRITAQLRLFNGQPQPVHIAPDTIWLALGYAPQPDGPRMPAEELAPFDLLPGQAADLTLSWSWVGEPYGSLGVGDYHYGISLKTQ